MINKEEKFITKKIDIWSSAIKSKSNLGRGSNKKLELYGIDKMRDLILELACKGLLVKAEKCSVVELNEVAEIIMGQAPAGKDCNLLGEGTVFVKTGQFGALYPEKNEWTTNPLKFAKRGDVLICVVGATIGKLNLGIDCAIGRSVSAIRPNIGLNSKYLYYSLLPYTLKLRRRSRGSAQGVIGKSELNSITIRFPHIAEQNLIVEKVEELMRLCDQLEKEHYTSIETHNSLITSLLKTIVSATINDTQFAKTWQTIRNNFDILFTTESDLDQLKQTIIQLAVMGKLVPQDPQDENTEILLNKISKEKAKLIQQGLIKKKKVLPELTKDQFPFQIPTSWTWQQLDNITSALGDGIHGTPIYDSRGKYHFINGNNLNDSEIEIKQDTKMVSHEEYEKYKKPLNETTILVSINGTIGKVALYNNEKIMLGKSACFFNLLGNINRFYLRVLMKSEYFLSYALQKATGSTIKNVSLKTMREFPVPLPPLGEQSRIVAKIDELLHICEQLKENISKKQNTQIKLADSLVEQAFR